MSKILRALFVSALATGIAAAALSVLNRRAPGPVMPFAEGPDPEHMTPEQERILLEELDAQL